MSAPKNRRFFGSDAKENGGIAALCRGFLTKSGVKRSGLPRDANKSAALKKKPVPYFATEQAFSF